MGILFSFLFPNSDLKTYKKRPALVVQANDLKTGINQIIVALITSNLGRGGHKSRVLVVTKSTEFALTGLKTDSVIVTDNLATIRVSFIDKTLGSFSKMGLIDVSLAHTFGLRLA